MITITFSQVTRVNSHTDLAIDDNTIKSVLAIIVVITCIITIAVIIIIITL